MGFTDAILCLVQVQRPMVLCGVSLGSAIAVQFALQHPEAVAGLVLSSPQVYVDGIGPMASMPWAGTAGGPIAPLRTISLKRKSSLSPWTPGAELLENCMILVALDLQVF